MKLVLGFMMYGGRVPGSYPIRIITFQSGIRKNVFWFGFYSINLRVYF
jgi:hypothetical protein